MNKRTITYLSLIAILSLTFGFLDTPYAKQKGLIPSLPESFAEQKINLGLDLQGGSQLDYKIDLRRVEPQDQEQIIEGVLQVINKRVNALGVSEPNIYRSQVGDEEHIVVELAGIKDLEQAKALVGKTIQLEFKEENTAPLSEQDFAAIEKQAETAFNRIQKEEAFEVVAEEESLAYPGKVNYMKASEDSYDFKSVLPDEYFPYIDQTSVESVVPKLIKATDGYTIDATGNLKALEGYFVIKVLDRREGEKNQHEDKEVKASHVLIAYSGAERADANVTRTEEEAKALAEEIQQKAASEEDFGALVQEYSDEAGSDESKGDLGFFKPGVMSKNFEDAAFALEKDQISEVVETEFGFHVIKVTDIKPEVNTTVTETEYKLEKLFYSTAQDPWKATELTGTYFKRAEVAFNQSYVPYVSIEFTDEGGKLFESLTEKNVNKKIAIFVGGELISAPNVNEKITGGKAQITGSFSIEEASNLARDLNTGAIPAPIVLVGQYTIGASLGQEAMENSMKAGLLGLAILAVCMVLYYRFFGLLADVALVIYALTLMFFIKIALPMGIAIILSLILFGVLVSKILKNKDSGWEKLISFFVACFALFFMSYMFANAIVLTLAGVAGVVLSIGMAVDANILIFERIREELRNKRPLDSAIEVGFERAWSSIRDSNFSSLITTAILMYVGTSIIKGFAVNLALGILISMFTAITITKTFLKSIVGTWIAKNDFLMGVPKKPHGDWKIVPRRKIWFAISGLLLVIGLLAIPGYGLKFGMDFTGGTLMELKFEEPVTAEKLIESVKTAEGELKAAQPAVAEENATTEEGIVEFGEPVVVSSGENSFIIRMKHLSSETHDQLVQKLQTSIGSFEEIRYSTIGATIGNTMKQKALTALILAVVMMVLYIAFAFRQIPKEIGPWRFGIAAIIALIHDIFITLGFYALLGHWTGAEVDALFVTAILTIIGFSVHDTIVVFDRIREKLKHQKRGESFEHVADLALNETLARSVNTSLSAIITVSILALFGAQSIQHFLLTLVVGFTMGTYSSIFVATPLLVSWHNQNNKK
ncbi:MAG: Protein-export membrane protein SecD [Candidatus Peregrinibacteria bacterium GW2011_GWA2_44_7]|nr:MAG: Protein-export membrane protein SecD [Candidatus Peregrinibacteria bacterium GW2011_GWA2_44_7]